jgi:hypothetical protein
LAVVVDVGDREGARIFDSLGALPLAEFFPPDGGQPAAGLRDRAGLELVFEGDSRWLKAP